MSKGWSYSAIHTFEICPRQYEARYVTKETKFEDTEHTIYGKDLHLACEEYIRDGKDLPPRFRWLLPTLEKINAIAGDKYCEYKMGVKKVDGGYEACDFFDADYFMRGVMDLGVVNGTLGRALDYKSGRNTRYADSRQLALMAAAMFLHFPELETIKAGLLFVVAGDFIKTSYTRETGFAIFDQLAPLLEQREVAYATGVFNARPSGLCYRHCQVLSCEHNGRR